MTAALNQTVIVALTSLLIITAGGLMLAADRRARVSNRRVANIVRSYRANGAIKTSRSAGIDLRIVQRLSGLLSALGIRTDRPDLYPISWGGLLLIAAAGAAVVDGLGYFLIGAIAWASLPFSFFLLARPLFKYFELRRNKLLYRQLPDALSMIVRSVRVGVTVQDSLRVVSDEAQWPTSIEFKRLLDEIRIGTSLSDALARLAERSGLIEYQFFAVALTLQSQSGGSLSESLENLADIVRKRVALRARAIALAAEARLTMYVLAGLPFVTTGALLVIQPDYLTVLITTSLGKKILFGGVALLAMGLTSMQVIIRKSTS
jgi:tight adherence protein B